MSRFSRMMAALILICGEFSCKTESESKATDLWEARGETMGELSGEIFFPPPEDVVEETSTPDWDIPNRPPLFDPIPPVEVKMGETLEVDLRPYFADPEEKDEALVLTWSAAHVAVELLTPGVVRLVGPVD